MFFANYGVFIHSLLKSYFNGESNRDELVTRYLCDFKKNVIGNAPSVDIYVSFFTQGLEYIKHITKPEGKILGVEERVDFCIEDHQFVGYIDLLNETVDRKIQLIDHKSRTLKPRSTRKKPTKTDMELDSYLRQLYLYSIPVHNKYGKYPDELILNCYRSGVFIKEPFSQSKLDEAVQWACDSINTICMETIWNPSIDYFKCKYLCELNKECEYYQMAGG